MSMIRQCRGPGKFEGESILTLYAYEVSLDGGCETVGDDDGGESYTLVDLAGLTRDELDAFTFNDPDFTTLNHDEIQELLTYAGAILWERSDGFVSAEWYGTPELLHATWESVVATYADMDDECDGIDA